MQHHTFAANEKVNSIINCFRYPPDTNFQNFFDVFCIYLYTLRSLRLNTVENVCFFEKQLT